MEEYVPTAPEIAPVAATSRASSMRVRARFKAQAQLPNFMPKVMGSAWMPWVRPTHSVFWNSKARRLQVSPKLLDVVDDDVAGLRDLVGQGRVAQVGRRHAVVHPAARLVGCPRACRRRCSSAMLVVNAMTSWFVTFSISSIALHGEVGVVADPLRPPRCVMPDWPSSAWASQASTSISFQMANLFCELPDATHFRTSIATDHARFLSLAVCADASAACAFSFVNRVPEIARFVGGSRPSDRFRRAETPRHRQHTSVCAQIRLNCEVSRTRTEE